MRILIVSPEVAPLAKTGGLADMTGSLAVALTKQGHEVALAMPYYRQVRKLGLYVQTILDDTEANFGGRIVRASVLKGVYPKTDITVYFVDCPEFFDREGLYQEGGEDCRDNLERFSLFCQAILTAIKHEYWQPHVIHCNDWQTALIPVYLKTWRRDDPFYNQIKILYTIHNLAYLGLFPKEKVSELHLPWQVFHIDGMEFYDKISLMKAGVVYSDRVNTVSPRYAEEIQTVEFGCGLEGLLRKRSDVLTGILNGADYAVWSPEADPLIAATYSVDDLSGKARCKEALQKENGLAVDPKMPLLGVISRLDYQKGLDLLAEAFPKLMQTPVQLVLLGTGDPKIEKSFEVLGEKFPGQAGIHLTYDADMAHRIEAGADFFLMPSRYEPCGLNQLYSLRYGAIPVVRATGGLSDSIDEFCSETGEGNGFLFRESDLEEFLEAVFRGLRVYRSDKWERLVRNAMAADFSWDASAAEYTRLYEEMVSEQDSGD